METKQLPVNKKILQCNRCPAIIKTRSKPVVGIGSSKAKIIIVGLAPGKDGADLTGIPFTRDPSGELITEMLSMAGLSRSQDVFITNLVKCNPKDSKGRNRIPSKKEIKNCSSYLMCEIDAIKPRIIVPLGSAATEFLLDSKIGKMTEVHATIHNDGGVLYFPFIHPGYVVRGAYNKEKYIKEFKALGDVYRDVIKQEARLSRLDILLLLLASSSTGKVLGKTKLQKLLFLVQHELTKRGFKARYAFRPYLYGPYSREIYTDVDWLRMNDLIAVNSKLNEDIGFLSEFAITTKGKQKVMDLKELPIFEDIGTVVHEVVKKYNEMTLSHLLDFVHREFSDYHKPKKRIPKQFDTSLDHFNQTISKNGESTNNYHQKEI